MAGRARLLAGAGQFLVEFFAGADAGEFDGDVFSGLQSVAADHFPGQRENFDRLAHVEDEDLPAAADGAGLHDELAGLGDGHEIAFHFGMGDGDRAAGFDLLAEDRHDAAAAAQDVAETNGDKPRAAIGGVQGLDVQLGAALGRAHDAGGVDRFVGADHDERRHARRPGGVGDDPRAEDVVLDRLAGIAFHHRHVLVGGAVEHDVRLMLFKHPRDAPDVADVGDDRHPLGADPAVAQFAVDFEQAVLRPVQQDHPARAEFHGLPADFRSDAAAGAGHEDILAGQEPLQFGGVEADRPAAQQIGQFEVASFLAAGFWATGRAVSSIRLWA